MKFVNATKFNRKSGEAEGSVVPRTIPGNIFQRENMAAATHGDENRLKGTAYLAAASIRPSISKQDLCGFSHRGKCFCRQEQRSAGTCVAN
jgi:hypothetical protein